MRYEIQGVRLMIIAEAGDAWAGEVRALRKDTVNGIPVLRCEDIVHEGRRVAICPRLDTRPDLARLVEAWEEAKRTAAAVMEENRRKELQPLKDRADREFEAVFAGILKEIGDGIRIEASHDACAADGWGATTYWWRGEELHPEVLAGIKIHQQWVESKVCWPGSARRVRSELIAWISRDDGEILRGRIAHISIAHRKAKQAKNTQAAAIEAARADRVAAGVRLASPRQLSVISRAREDWFDLFDGAGPYGMHGPTDEQLELLSSEEASDLIVAIRAAREG